MKKGCLASYFDAVAAKRLTAVEADVLCSHQHEFNGVAGFRKMFGDARRSFSTKFLYFSSQEDDIVLCNGEMTWYDAREKHPTRTEYRLYYPSLLFWDKISEGDFLIICKQDENNLVVVITEGGGTKEYQLRWLFNLSENEEDYDHVEYKEIEEGEGYKLDYISNIILEEIGIDVTNEFVEENLLDKILREFPTGFPPTKVFSKFARKNCHLDLDDLESDEIILAWMEHEEVLFRTFEKYMVETRLSEGFRDVEEFTSFALSVLNRRKSRAGLAFENHLIEIFKLSDLSFSYNEKTEMKSRPDFIFPGIEQYRDGSFSSELLHMLAVKTSCKDRWRQVLAEAARIKTKHLITLEPSISQNQTDEMVEQKVRLVLPKVIHQTYTAAQREQLICLAEFIELVR